eukprot:3939471-Rhodomonas_salina.1
MQQPGRDSGAHCRCTTSAGRWGRNQQSERLLAGMAPFLSSLPLAEKQRLQGLSGEMRLDSSSERSEAEQRLYLQSLPPAEREELAKQWAGLGWSQKAEVAWLEREGLAFEELD